MITKGPNVQRPYDEYYSGDPAFVQPPISPGKDADDEERTAYAVAAKAYVESVERARETGDWSHLRVEGSAPPTRFHVKPMPGEAFREICARIENREPAVLLAPWAFRAAIVKMENAGEHEIKWENHPRFGRIATNATTNYLDAIDMSIVTEIGLVLAARGTQGLSPKS